MTQVGRPVLRTTGLRPVCLYYTQVRAHTEALIAIRTNVWKRTDDGSKEPGAGGRARLHDWGNLVERKLLTAGGADSGVGQRVQNNGHRIQSIARSRIGLNG